MTSRHTGEAKVYLNPHSTPALEARGWSAPRPGRFTTGKQTRYPLYRRLDWPWGRCGWVRKISPSLEFDPRTIQPLASRYTDSAIPELKVIILHILIPEFLDSDGKTKQILNYECVYVNIILFLYVIWDGSASTFVETRAPEVNIDLPVGSSPPVHALTQNS